jgi:hypothetical protein
VSLRDPSLFRKAAHMVTSGDNVYVVWWSNKTGNDEMLKASTDKPDNNHEKFVSFRNDDIKEIESR